MVCNYHHPPLTEERCVTLNKPKLKLKMLKLVSEIQEKRCQFRYQKKLEKEGTSEDAVNCRR
jgi:hypothetical protein